MKIFVSRTPRLWTGAALLLCGTGAALLAGCGGGAMAGPLVPNLTGPQGHILFSRDNKLWLINADGTGEHMVPNTDGLFFGKLSPDSTKIVTALTVAGNTDVYSLNSDGSNQQRLTIDPAIDGSPVWSGDGNKIAFCSSRLPNPAGNRNVDIFTMNANGSNQKVLQNTNGDECPTAWSPDNNLIAFTSNKNNGETDSVFVIGSDGENEHLLSVIGTGGVFTPDSKSVVYDAYREGNLRILSVTGTISRVLVTGSHQAVAPNGGYLVYRVFRDGVEGLFISSIDGTQTKLLVANADNPSWER